jgi:hypothetical protein
MRKKRGPLVLYSIPMASPNNVLKTPPKIKINLDITSTPYRTVEISVRTFNIELKEEGKNCPFNVKCLPGED